MHSDHPALPSNSLMLPNIHDPNMVIIIPVDVSAPDSPRPSAGTALVVKLPVVFYLSGFVQNGRRNPMLYMMMSANGNIFRVTGHLWGEFTGHRWIPTQRPVMRSFDISFDLRLNKRLSKQSWGWWYETSSCSLWRHCSDIGTKRLISDRCIKSASICYATNQSPLPQAIRLCTHPTIDSRAVTTMVRLPCVHIANTLILLLVWHSV